MKHTIACANHFSRRILLGLSFFAVILSFNGIVVGQEESPTNPKRGFNPGGSYALSDIETIDTTNGNMILRFPLGKLPPGRAGLTAGVNLLYNSKLWDTHVEYVPDLSGEICPQNFLGQSEAGGWRYGSRFEVELINRNHNVDDPPQCPDPHSFYIWKLQMIFPDGSRREFRPTGYSDYYQDGFFNIRPDGWTTSCPNGTQPGVTSGMTYFSTDGTYMRLFFPYPGANGFQSTWILSMPDGTRVTTENWAQRIYDRNNNYVELTYVDNYNNTGQPARLLIDQEGRAVATQYDYASGEDLIHVSGVNNEQLTWRVSWKSIDVNKSYTTTSAGGSGQERGGTSVQQFEHPLRVVDRITMPAQSGGLTYIFGYNADTANPSLGWGEVNAITLPSSAVASYGYFLDGNGGPIHTNPRIDRVLEDHPTSKTLTYQQEYDGSSTPVSETWQYAVSHSGSSIIGPDGGVSTESFGDTSYPNAANGLSFTSTRPDGTVIERIWQQNLPFGLNNLVQTNPYVKTEFTSIRDAGGNLVKTAIRDYNYDKNGNVTQIREYDWVDYASVPRANGFPSGIPGNAILKRVTTNSYARPTADASVSFDSGDCYQNPGAPYLRNAIAATEVSDGAQPLARVEFVYDDSGNTGNLTQQISWDSTKGGYSNPLNGGNSISVYNQYDAYGNPVLHTDARGYQTQIVYGNVNGFTGLYPTETRSAYQTAVQRTETRQYDFYTGVVTRITDTDNNISTSTAYDVFGRPTLVRAAEGKPEEIRTATEYSDSLRRVIIRSDLNGIGDGVLVAVQHFDQLGRLRLTRQLENSASQSASDETMGIKSQTRYLFSGSNSYVLTSNPYRAANSGAAGGEATMGWIRNKSDNAGRVVEVQMFAGAGLPAPWGGNGAGTGTIVSSYNANEATVTDQSGKSRKSVIDALGRLVQVYEDPAGLNYLTGYGYNAVDSLVNVNQDAQTRTFAYDSLKRLSFATNPESGTINYQYDNNGNLTQKNDARGVVTSYAYDALNRATSRAYSDGTPSVSYAYDSTSIANGRGRLAAVGSSVSSYSYTGYDALGRVLGGSQTIGSQSYPVHYTYDRAGHVLTQTYPSGRTVTNTYDPAGRANSIAGNLGDGAGRTYSTGITYGAGGQITQEQFGTATPIYNKLFYNSRSQLVEIRESTAPNDTSWNRGAIINNYGSSDNNGNLKQQDTYVPHDDQISSYSSWPSVYQYDGLNRLTIAWEAGNPWPGIQQAYQYDRYGNRTIDQANTVGNVPRTAFAVDTNTNRLMVPNGQGGAMSYDAAGNLILDSYTGEGARVYDAENRMTQAWANNQWQLYSYDGDGRRVKRHVNGTETWQVYGIGGELLAEYAANTDASNPLKEYGYRNGQLLVTAEPSANVHWMATDQLGTPRMIFDSTGSLSGTSRHDYLPFGEELFAGTNWRTPQIGYGGDGTRQKFTQKERDNETSLDYSINRYYSSVQGRFTGTDPLSGEPNRPQSWNRYSYVLNNPLKFIDPDGLRWVQRRLADGLTQYGWCDTEECYNTAINTKSKNYAGWTAVTFDETESFTYRIAGGGGDRYDSYQLNPDGTHGCTTCEAMSTDWNAQFAIGGLLRGGMIGLGRGFAALFGRQAATTAGGEALTGLYGELSAESLAMIERAAASQARVEVFTKITSAPALGKSLHVALDEGGATAARATGQIYKAQIPRALLDQLVRSGLATKGQLTWKGGKRVSEQYHILPQAAKFVVDYFKK